MVGLCTRLAIERAGTETPHLQRGAPDFYPNSGTPVPVGNPNSHLSLQKDAPVRRDASEQGACVRRRSWAGYTINMFEFEFPTGTRPWNSGHLISKQPGMPLVSWRMLFRNCPLSPTRRRRSFRRVLR
jgi:hypothetical protein